MDGCECDGACAACIEVRDISEHIDAGPALDEEDIPDAREQKGNLEADPEVRTRFIKGIVMDKDTKNSLVWRMDPRTSVVSVYFDPGHVKKNLVKQLKKICKMARGYISLPERLGTHFMHLVKEAERACPDSMSAMRAWFLERWAHTMEHNCCGPGAKGCEC